MTPTANVFVLILGLLLAALSRGDVPECVVLLCDPRERAHLWLEGAQSEAVRVYHSIFGGWLPTTCAPRAPRRRVPGCITNEMLCTPVQILGAPLRREECQTSGCHFARFFPQSSARLAQEWLEQAEQWLSHAWDVYEIVSRGEICNATEGFTYDEIVAYACAAETVYSTVLKALTPNSPWRDRKFVFHHILSSPTILNLYETDHLPQPIGDQNDFVHKQRSIESYITCCSIENRHAVELQSVALHVSPRARGTATSDQQLLWVIDAPVSDFPTPGPCAGQQSNINDAGNNTAFAPEYGQGDTTTAAEPEVGVKWPGSYRHYLHPRTAVLAETTDTFWPPSKAGQLVNVVVGDTNTTLKRRSFAFFSVRTPGIHPADLHGNDDDDDDHLIARVVVRERNEIADNCRDYDPSTQVVVNHCVPCSWPFEGFPIGPITLADEQPLCVGGPRNGQRCDPNSNDSGLRQCTAAGACLQTRVSIFGGLTFFDEYVCFDWPKPGPNPSYPCKPDPLECPYGICYQGDGAYPLFGAGGEWYSEPDVSAVVISSGVGL